MLNTQPGSLLYTLVILLSMIGSIPAAVAEDKTSLRHLSADSLSLGDL